MRVYKQSVASEENLRLWPVTPLVAVIRLITLITLTLRCTARQSGGGGGVFTSALCYKAIHRITKAKLVVCSRYFLMMFSSPVSTSGIPDVFKDKLTRLSYFSWITLCTINTFRFYL